MSATRSILQRNIIQRFKFPKAVERDVLHLIEHHMFNYQSEWTDSAVRRFIAKTGTDTLDNLFSLRRADQYGMAGKRVDSGNLKEFGDRIGSVLDAGARLQHQGPRRKRKHRSVKRLESPGAPRWGLFLIFCLRQFSMTRPRIMKRNCC